jgi:hypothetical protein
VVIAIYVDFVCNAISIQRSKTVIGKVGSAVDISAPRLSMLHTPKNFNAAERFADSWNLAGIVDNKTEPITRETRNTKLQNHCKAIYKHHKPTLPIYFCCSGLW